MRSVLICVSLLGAVAVGILPVDGQQTEQDAEAPIAATSCELENHPRLYDEKLVEVRGRVSFGKFGFFLNSDCKPDGGVGVWIDFGGDVVSPYLYWGIWDYLGKQKGHDVRVRGMTIPIVRDRLMERFISDVASTRFRKPDGDGCGPECQFYRVTATVRGVFFSGLKGGFGFNQASHGLVIERVMEISSKRTSVPAGGVYECSIDRWQPREVERKELAKVAGCSLRADFHYCEAELAKHWGDSIDAKGGIEFDGPWVSHDMTKYYVYQGNFIQQLDGSTVFDPKGLVTRELCRAAQPPLQNSEHVWCEFHETTPIDDTAILEAVAEESGGEEWRVSDMTRVGWVAFEVAAKEWAVEEPGSETLMPVECSVVPAGVGEDGRPSQWGYCTWHAKDDFVMITVEMGRKGTAGEPMSDLAKLPWVAEKVTVDTCHGEAGNR